MYANTFVIETSEFGTNRFSFSLNQQVETDSLDDLGMIVIEYEVEDYLGNDIYTPDLGTGKNTSDEIECDCNADVKCKIFLGSGTAPTQVIVYPQTVLGMGSTLELHIPKLFNPADAFRGVKMTIYAQNLDKATETWDIVSYFEEVFYVTLDNTYATEVVSGPTIGDLRVGAMNTVEWDFTLVASYGDMFNYDENIDKVQIWFDKQEIEIITNNKQVATPPQLTCAGWTYIIYYENDMIEFTPDAQIPAGTAVTLDCDNFFNPQYVIRNGVQMTIYAMNNGFIQKRYDYDVINYLPNELQSSQIVSSAIGPNYPTSSQDVYTITFHPTNYLREGMGKIYISFDYRFSGITNCEIVQGILGRCEIQDNGAGLDYLIITDIQYYNPDVAPEIVLTVIMTSPAIAGTYNFNYRSVWEEKIPDTDEDEVDVELIGSMTYVLTVPQFTLFEFNDQRIYTRDSCHNGRDHGIIKFEIDFTDSLVWHEDLIRVYPFPFGHYTGGIVTNPRLDEFICTFYFDDVLHTMKAEYCDIENDGHLVIMPPEAKGLFAGNRMIIQVQWRGQLDRGLNYNQFPDLLHMMVMADTVKVNAAQEVGILEWQPRACFWGTRSYISTNHNQNQIFELNVNDYSWNQMNRGQSWQGRDFRLQVHYSTFNEMKQVAHLNMGYEDLTTATSHKYLPTLFQYNHATISFQNLIYSEEFPDHYGQVWNVPNAGLDMKTVATVDYITGSNIGSTNIHWGLTGFRNYEVTDLVTLNDGTLVTGNRNTFTHCTISSQVMLQDNTWWDINRIVHWYHIPAIQPVVDEGAITNLGGSSQTVSDVAHGIIHITLQMQYVPPATYGFGIIHLRLEHNWDEECFHPRRRTHGNRRCYNGGNTLLTCTTYGSFWSWISYRINDTNGNNRNLRIFGMHQSPHFRKTNNYRIEFHSGNLVRFILTGTHEVWSNNPHIILEQELRDNPVNTLVHYRIGVLNFRYNDRWNRIEFWIPEDFQSVGPLCRLNFGFTKIDVDNYADKPVCNIGTENLSGTDYHHVQFTNMSRWSRRWWTQYAGFFIFDLEMMNPVAPGWNLPWRARGFNSPTNDTQVFLETDFGDSRPRYWVGEVVPVGNFFRVFTNRQTHYERRQAESQWGELVVRLRTKNVLPANDGKIELHLPSDYDIPNGGNNICKVGHKDHTDLDGQFCEIDNERKVRVNTNQNYGVDSVCTLVRVTTEWSVNNDNGFQAPQSPTTGNFEIYVFEDTVLKEYEGDDLTAKALPLDPGVQLNITATVIEEDIKGVFKVSFHAPIQIRPGYDSDPLQTDPFKKVPQGLIRMYFNTRDRYVSGRAGFDEDLGYTGAVVGTGFPINCVALGSMTVPDGERLSCEVFAATDDNFYTPARIDIKNFDFIQKNQEYLEFHILDLTWVRNRNNEGWVKFEVAELKADGSETVIIEQTQVDLGAERDEGVTNTDITAPDLPVFSPDEVGALLSLTFYIEVPNYIYQNDLFEIYFPAAFEFPPNQSDVSAVFQIVVPQAGATPALEYFFDVNTHIYHDINLAHFTIPKGKNIYGCTNARPCQVSMITNGFRHISYADPTPFDIGLRIISQQVEYRIRTWINIPAPIVAPFNSQILTVSSLFSEDVYVTYTFFFTPSYHYPTDTIIRLTMEYSKYRHIDKSFPKAQCTTNFPDITKSCIISEAQVEIVLSGRMEEGFSANFVLTGVKNPKYVGATGSTDLLLTSIHPTTFEINRGYYNILTYTTKKNIDLMFFSISLTSYYEQVSQDYKFTIQNTNKLPAFGTINIELPAKWSQSLPDDAAVSYISGTFTTEKLIYSYKFILEPNSNVLLTIIPEFEWPSKTPLVIAME